MYYTVRIDADPTTWELTKGVDGVPGTKVPEVLEVYHPLLGDLVLSPRSVGSSVFLEYRLLDTYGTRPNGYPIPKGEAGALYLPTPIGLAPHIQPPNLYGLGSPANLAVLKADIIAAMTKGTFLTVEVTGGEVVINGAELPFAVLCPPHS